MATGVLNKNVKIKIIKIRTGYQYVEYHYYSETLYWAAQNLGLGNKRAPGWTQLGINSHRRVDEVATFGNCKMNRLLCAEGLVLHAWVISTWSSARF